MVVSFQPESSSHFIPRVEKNISEVDASSSTKDTPFGDCSPPPIPSLQSPLIETLDCVDQALCPLEVLPPLILPLVAPLAHSPSLKTSPRAPVTSTDPLLSPNSYTTKLHSWSSSRISPNPSIKGGIALDSSPKITLGRNSALSKAQNQASLDVNSGKQKMIHWALRA